MQSHDAHGGKNRSLNAGPASPQTGGMVDQAIPATPRIRKVKISADEGALSQASSGGPRTYAVDGLARKVEERVWLVIASGLLGGILIMLLALLLFQMQSNVVLAARPISLPRSAVSKQQEGAAAQQPAPIVGRYPPDFTLNTLSEQPVRLSALRGKPVWVNFWASWCPPCRAEMPEMKQKYAAYKSKGLVIVGVDMGEDPGTVKQFISTNGYDWTFVLDRDQSVAQRFFVSALPTHFFIGGDGLIKAVQVGGMTGNLMDRYLNTLINQ